MALGIDHVSLVVQDLEAAIDFFNAGFSMTLVFQENGMTGQIQSMLGLPDGAECDIAQLKSGDSDVRLELIAFRVGQSGVGTAEMGRPDLPVGAGMGHVGFWAYDFDDQLAKLEALEARMIGHITEFEAGRSVYLITGFGAFIELSERRRKEAAENLAAG